MLWWEALDAGQWQCWAQVPMAMPVLHTQPAEVLGPAGLSLQRHSLRQSLGAQRHQRSSRQKHLLLDRDMGSPPATSTSILFRCLSGAAQDNQHWYSWHSPLSETTLSLGKPGCHSVTQAVSPGRLCLRCQANSALHRACPALTSSRRKYYTSAVGPPLPARCRLGHTTQGRTNVHLQLHHEHTASSGEHCLPPIKSWVP